MSVRFLNTTQNFFQILFSTGNKMKWNLILKNLTAPYTKETPKNDVYEILLYAKQINKYQIKKIYPMKTIENPCNLVRYFMGTNVFVNPYSLSLGRMDDKKECIPSKSTYSRQNLT